MLHWHSLRPSPLPRFPAELALLWPLVIPEPEEHRLTQQAFFGPLGKLYFTHESGLDPAGTRLLGENADTGRTVPPDALECYPDRGELLFGKAAAGSAAVDELAGAIGAEMQRTEATPASFRRAEADDDEILRAPGTNLHPGG